MPLKPEQLTMLRKKIKDAKKTVVDARIDLNQAKRAGVPVAEHEKDLQRMETSLRLMERTYGPIA